MIEVALIFFGTFVLLPAGLSFTIDGDGSSRKKKSEVVELVEEPVPEPEPILVARLKSTKKTVVTVTPECSDKESETRLREASLEYLEKVDGLPDETVFEVQECSDEGMVDIQIIETIEKIH
tara:strand:+ start:762 stop:1127 length:366 start_codon:yes stop_codon:yes gene_type:complete